jgi:uncharacterized protein (DUF952 family)
MALWQIATKDDWEQAQRAGVYRAPSLAAVGFIHLSEERQWRGVAKRFFKGRRELLLLELDPAALKSEVRTRRLMEIGFHISTASSSSPPS